MTGMKMRKFRKRLFSIVATATRNFPSGWLWGDTRTISTPENYNFLAVAIKNSFHRFKNEKFEQISYLRIYRSLFNVFKAKIIVGQNDEDLKMLPFLKFLSMSELMSQEYISPVFRQ